MTSLAEGRPARGKGSSMARREARWGYIFLSPWIVGFLAFTLVPMVATLIFSFTDITLDPNSPVHWVGLHNWQRLLSDPQVWKSLGVTISFAAIQLPIAVLVPFLIALLLNSKRLIAPGLFRVLFFMPYTVPFVAGILIWQQMENQTSGWIDGAIRAIPFLHLTGPNWLSDPGVIYPALVMLGLWGVGGGMIVYLGGLAGIPTDLYEAARIDGAGWWSQLRHITIPMMSPVFLYTLVLGIVDVLQYFLVVEVINNGTGEPGGSTFFYNLYVYKNMYAYKDEALASAMAWLLFLITLGITLVVFLSARRWVYYAGER
jgi:ABC-type sugar transport system permease subunit